MKFISNDGILFVEYSGYISLIMAIIFYLVIQESPKWLVLKGRQEEAVRNIIKIGNYNAFFNNSQSEALKDDCKKNLVPGRTRLFLSLVELENYKQKLMSVE
mmetsp:Transcript_8435/g.14128  ORF Transcript_8435/g.14128 Transcript_8435/m.14128 type:complete len:102 (+) Transcript_8435:1159-1464(+)